MGQAHERPGVGRRNGGIVRSLGDEMFHSAGIGERPVVFVVLGNFVCFYRVFTVLASTALSVYTGV